MANREQALAAILASLEGLKIGGTADAGVKLVERNRQADIPDDQFDALVLEDGDNDKEIVLLDRHGLVGPANEDVTECVIWGMTRGPSNTVGALLNALYFATIRRLATDPVLRAALGVHGRIIKQGAAFKFFAGEQVVGFFGLALAVTTILKPSDP